MQTTMRSGDGISEKAAAGIDRLATGAHDALDRAAAAATSTAQQLGARGDELLATRDAWLESTRGYVRQHPFAALGAAFAVGFLLSRLTR